MSLLKSSDRDFLKQQFLQLQDPVKLVLFVQALDCDYCPMTQEILEELAGLSEKIELEVLNYAIDKERAAHYKIARIPGFALVRMETVVTNGIPEIKERDYGIRYYGLPSGYEFGSLVGDIMDVSRGDSGLSDQTKAALAELKDPLHMQVFVTPT